ncbi:MAG TPA: IS630 family transposase [Campylobacterales bacterium]|nr:IS630 family transposase [Campylobacterales bacterium]
MELKIAKEEILKLRQLHRTVKDGRIRDKIKTILMLNGGYKSEEISRVLLIDSDTVTNWKKSFVKRKNIDSWYHYSYKSYNGKLSKKEETLFVEYLENNLVHSSKQAIDFVEQAFQKNYTESGMVSLLHKLGFVYKQTSLIPSKYDAKAQSEFKQAYENLEKEQKTDEVILFMDGVHPQHNTTTSKVWIKKGKEKHVKSNTGRSRINLNGIYNPKTQDILVHESKTINAESTIEFFKEIEDYYEETKIKRIQIIVDNAKYYKNKTVKKYIETSRIELLFLPPYSPNLNLIERVWKLLRKKIINSHYYEKFKEFKEAVLGFFENSENMKSEIEQFVGNKMHLFENDFYPKTNSG